MITRKELVGALQAALEPLDFVHAMWESGSASFGRLDELSDLDICLDVEPDSIELTIKALEYALEGLARNAGVDGPAVARRYRLREPTWHGHTQVFYELSGTGPFLMLDVVVMKHGQGMRFNEREQHGEPIVYFDKSGVVAVTGLNWETHSEKLRERLEDLTNSFHLFQPLVRKELLRQDALSALGFYQGLTLRPLVELMRIVHDPARHNFHLRYLKHILAPQDQARLQRLCFNSDPAALEQAHAEACAWFDELMPLATAKWCG